LVLRIIGWGVGEGGPQVFFWPLCIHKPFILFPISGQEIKFFFGKAVSQKKNVVLSAGEEIFIIKNFSSLNFLFKTNKMKLFLLSEIKNVCYWMQKNFFESLQQHQTKYTQNSPTYWLPIKS